MEIANLIEKGMYVLLGILFAAITNHFLSKSRERQIHSAISFHAAAEKFRAPFDDALFNIDQGEHAASLLLQQFFKSHKLAMFHFKYRLTGIANWRFKKAWCNYEKFYRQAYQKDDIIAQLASAKTENEIRTLDELRKHIEKLLKYTT